MSQNNYIEVFKYFLLTVFTKYRKRIWYNLPLNDIEQVWRPILYLTNSKQLHGLGSIGDKDTKSFWYKHPSILYFEEVMYVTINCDMDFREFPLDSQQCDFKMRNWIGLAKNVQLVKPEIMGENLPVLEDGVLWLNTTKLNYNIKLYALNSTTYKQNEHLYSMASVRMQLFRNTVGFMKIVTGFYATTGTFSVLSLISFFIEPNVVIMNE